MALPLHVGRRGRGTLGITHCLGAIGNMDFITCPKLRSRPGRSITIGRVGGKFNKILSFKLGTSRSACGHFIARLGMVASTMSLNRSRDLVMFLNRGSRERCLCPRRFRGKFFHFDINVRSTRSVVRSLERTFRGRGLVWKTCCRFFVFANT